MRRIAAAMLSVLLIVLVAGYTSEVFTGEVQYEESCPICRAVRVSGRRYGLRYERVEECALTKWYRGHIDPLHGLDPQHPHQWRQSACTVFNRRGWDALDYECASVAPVFLLNPDVELCALLQIPDQETQIGLIHSLDSPDRRTDTDRAKLLIEYYFAVRDHITWHDWWVQHGYQFGLAPPPPPPVPHPAEDKDPDLFLRHSPVASPSSVLPK